VVSHLEWSKDNHFILVGIARRGIAAVRSVSDANWNCKIDEGMAGLMSCRWAPSARHILTVSDFKVRLTVWSLSDKTI